jgi:hypothetical protein
MWFVDPQVMGGRFASIMPSDITKPGALAFESIPAKGENYAKASIKRELARIFRRDGCHHCGECWIISWTDQQLDLLARARRF